MDSLVNSIQSRAYMSLLVSKVITHGLRVGYTETAIFCIFQISLAFLIWLESLLCRDLALLEYILHMASIAQISGFAKGTAVQTATASVEAWNIPQIFLLYLTQSPTLHYEASYMCHTNLQELLTCSY
jgi:hypothetical protein